MKRMIKEELYDIIPITNFTTEPTEVYKNPYPTELNDINSWRMDKNLRAVVDIKNKDVYIFDSEFLHYNVRLNLKSTNPEFNDDKAMNILIRGESQLILKNDEKQKYPIDNIPWIKKYFSSYDIA